MPGRRGTLHTDWLGFVAGFAAPRDIDKLAFRTVVRRPVSADGHVTNKDTCCLPRWLFALLVAPANGSRCCRLAALAVCQAGYIISQIRPTDQSPDSPGMFARRALRETLIAFPARFPTPSSSVSNQAGGWPEANPIDSATAPTAGR